MPLQPGHRLPGGVHQRGLDLVGPRVQRGGLVLLAVLAGLTGGDPVGGVQDRHALDRAHGQVEIRHLMRVLATLSRADLGQLGRAGVRVRGQVRRYCLLFPLVSRLGLTALDQEFPAGTDVVLVQAPDHARVHLAAQPKPCGSFPGPLPGRLCRRGVVRHGPGAAAAVLTGGEVGHVVASVQRDVSRHDP